jgi:hypothetical protein
MNKALFPPGQRLAFPRGPDAASREGAALGAWQKLWTAGGCGLAAARSLGYCPRVCMKWITREKVKVDRVACPWLIKRFIDPEAEFLFVPAGEVMGKAAALGATMFDIEGCELGHHGEDVSFNSFLKRFNLTDPALMLLGEIVRAADSHPSNPHPAGEGLRWVAHGFSALAWSDQQILEREFVVYDALYAECRRRVGTAGSDRKMSNGR